MKQNSSYLLKELAGVPYLLPYGQMIADHRRGLKTNATGAYLWSLLETERTMEEVLSLSAAHYEVSEVELPAFQKDITQFLQQLLAYGIIIEQDSQVSCATTVFSQLEASRTAALSNIGFPADRQTVSEQQLSIGGLTLQLLGPAEAFPPDFADFVIPEAPQIHQTIFISPTLPQQINHGQIILHNQELVIINQEEQYLLYFPTSKRHLEIHLSKAADTARCYCLPPYDSDFHYDLFHAIRLLYLYLAQRHGMAALHSASLLYRDKLWLFSGPSGMGKSTHTNLWREHFGTPVINGDLNLLALVDGTPVVHGIPWCGTSETYDTKTYPLGGIILLNKAKENTIEQLTRDQKQLLVSQRFISPAWTPALYNLNLNLAEAIVGNVLVCRLHCTKEKAAAELIRQEIDNLLKKAD